MFGIPKKAGEIRQVMGFVVGRFFSDFPDHDYGSQDGVTWGSWAQFVKAREESQRVYDTQVEVALKLFNISTSPVEEQNLEDEIIESIRLTKAGPR